MPSGPHVSFPDAVGGQTKPVSPATKPAGNMLPRRQRRRFGAERVLVRVIATAGIVAIGVAIAAIMGSAGSQEWLIGLVVGCISVVLSAVLWSSRQV